MRVLAVSALSFFAVCGPLAAEELGPAFAGFSVQMSAGFETPGGQLFEIGTITGTLDFEDDAAGAYPPVGGPPTAPYAPDRKSVV